jgi:hypothetical protein
LLRGGGKQSYAFVAKESTDVTFIASIGDVVRQNGVEV